MSFSVLPKRNKAARRGLYMLCSLVCSSSEQLGVTGDWFLCLRLSCMGEGSGMHRGWTFQTFQGTCFGGSSCSHLLIFSTTASLHCLAWLTLSPGRGEAETLLGKLGMCCWHSKSTELLREAWENADIWGLCTGFGIFLEAIVDIYILESTNVDTLLRVQMWHPSKAASHVPVEVPNLWILLCVPLSFLVN